MGEKTKLSQREFAQRVAERLTVGDDRAEIIVNSLRLAIGYAARHPGALKQADFERMYEDLCQLSSLLDIDPMVVPDEEVEGRH